MKRIWHELLLKDDYGTFFSLSLHKWVFYNLKTNGQKDNNGSGLAFWGSSLGIWHWHSNYIFEESATSVANMVINIKSREEKIHRTFDVLNTNKYIRVEEYFGWVFSTLVFLQVEHR